jgi:hypothetical protein
MPICQHKSTMLLRCSCRCTRQPTLVELWGHSPYSFLYSDISFRVPTPLELVVNCDPNDITILTTRGVSVVNFVSNLGTNKGKKIRFCDTAASPRALVFSPRTEGRDRTNHQKSSTPAESASPEEWWFWGERVVRLALRMRCGEARMHLALQSGSLRSAPLASSSVASPPSSTRRPPPAATHRRTASSATPPAVPTISRLALAAPPPPPPAAQCAGAGGSALCSLAMWRLELGLGFGFDFGFRPCGVGRIYRREESGAGNMGEAACRAMGWAWARLLTSI